MSSLVSRARLTAALVLVVCLIGLAFGSPASAQNFPPPHTTPPPTSSPPSSGGSTPGSGSSQGSDGGPVHGTVRSCSVYATSSSFGLSCLSGGAGDAKTVREILGHDPVPTCWDTRVSDADLVSQYEYQPNPLAPYYVLSCISGLNPNASLFNQPGLNLSQKLVEIQAGAPSCGKQPFTPAQTAGIDTSCVMVLVGNQTLVTGYLDRQNAQIPSVSPIVTYPAARVRTQVDTAFVDRADCADCASPTRTNDHGAGGVVLYAEMTSFRIEPYGPDGPDQKTCNGTADVSPTDTPATKPTACWYRYTRSSNGQPGDRYPFRAEATWSVKIKGATPGQDRVFATFHKYTDVQLPVSDIQTVVIPSTP